MDILNFNVSQTKHNRSFQTSNLDFTINLVAMLMLKNHDFIVAHVYPQIVDV